MRPTAEVLESKYHFALKMIRDNPSISTPDLQRKIHKKFGFKLSGNKIAEARKQVADEDKGKSVARGIKQAGERARLGVGTNGHSHKSGHTIGKLLTEVRGELLLEQQARDLADIISKRLPGVKFFHLDIDERTGKPKVKYQVVTEVSGNVSL